LLQVLSDYGAIRSVVKLKMWEEMAFWHSYLRLESQKSVLRRPTAQDHPQPKAVGWIL
jgi:hypothetical protein